MRSRVQVTLLLLVVAAGVQGCELAIEAAEGMEFAELDAAAFRGAGAGSFAEGAGALRSLAMEEIPLGRAGALSDALATGAAETAEGRAAATVAADGSIVARGRTWGRLASNGDVFMRSSTSAAEVRVGRVADGIVWAPDRGGNVLPIARVRGFLKITSYGLRTSAAGAESGIRIERDTPIDVLRAQNGWYEIRPTGQRTTGWVEAGALTVGLSEASGLDSVAGAILTCVRYDSVTGHPPDEATKAPAARTAELSALNASLSGRHVILRYPTASAATADSMARLMDRAGAHVIRQEIDVPATEHCGGDIYYHRDDLRAARNLQGLLADVDRLRLSSFEIDEARFLVWLR